MPASSDLQIAVSLATTAAVSEADVARLDPDIARALRVYCWDSASVFACASSFVLMFYLREEFQKSGKYGYAVQNLLEAAISIAATYPFALKSRFVNGDNHREAIRNLLRYVPVYFPLNTLYQIAKDWLAAVEASHSLVEIDFIPYTNGPTGWMDMLGGLGVYGVGFSSLYYGLSRAMRLPATAMDVLKTGMQYSLSFLIGAAFNTDLSVGVARLPNVFYTGLTLSGTNFLFDTLTNRDIRSALQQRLCVGPTPAVTPAISPVSDSQPDEKQEPLLDPAVVIDSSVPDSPREPRHQRGSFSLFKSYLCFWRTSGQTPVDNLLKRQTSSPAPAQG